MLFSDMWKLCEIQVLVSYGKLYWHTVTPILSWTVCVRCSPQEQSWGVATKVV